MARMGFRFRIAPGTEAEYERRHQQVWPEMLAAIRHAGYRNYSIFRDGTDLFGYFEADDARVTLETIAASPVGARWEAFMRDILDRGADDATGIPRGLTEVFHLD
jgi:L-rhamnose mutarotase